MVSERVKVVKGNITTDCTWCGYEETTYHVTKACTVTRTLAQAIRTLHCTAVIGGVEVGRLISDAPLTSLASVPGQCLWWGLQKIWLLCCQRVMRRIQVNVQDLYAAMCATFMDAAAWFQQAGEQDVSALANKLSLWYLSKQQSLAAAERQELLREWDRRKGASAQVGQGMGKRLRSIRERAAGKASRKRARVEEQQESTAALNQGLDPGTVHAWIDGSALMQGTQDKEVKAGAGGHSPQQQFASIEFSEPLPGAVQTNNRAELYALVRLLERAPRQVPLHVHSDSLWVLERVRAIRHLRERGFKNEAGKKLKHADLWERVHNQILERTAQPTYEHVYSHTKDANNDRADELAKKGAHKRQWRRIAISPSVALPMLPQTGKRILGTPTPLKRVFAEYPHPDPQTPQTPSRFEYYHRFWKNKDCHSQSGNKLGKWGATWGDPPWPGQVPDQCTIRPPPPPPPAGQGTVQEKGR